MDGFTGFKTAAAEEIPDAVTVMDPFHVVRLAGDALDRCRRRIQLAIHVTVGSGTTRSTSRGARRTPARTCSPTSRATGYARCSLITLTSRSRRPEVSTSA